MYNLILFFAKKTMQKLFFKYNYFQVSLLFFYIYEQKLYKTKKT